MSGLRFFASILLVLSLGSSLAVAAEIHDLATQGDVTAIATAVAADPSLLQLVDEEGNAPLALAAAAGQDSLCTWLLDQGARVDASNHEQFSALLYAVARNHLSTATLLLERGAPVDQANDYERTPLLWCSRETGNYDMAVLLLDAGADINAADQYGATPIELVSWRGFRRLVNLYLERGCRLSIAREKEWFMLENVTKKGLDQLYARMIEAGVRVDVTSNESGGWLHRAASGGSPVILADLLKRGAEINAVDGFGWTALHHAASHGRPDAVTLLVERGADTELRTLSGWSARNLAMDRGHFKVERILNKVHPSRRFPRLKDKYFGQKPPKNSGEVFAPDIVSAPLGGHSSLTLSPKADHMLWHQYTDIPDSGYWTGTVFESRLVDKEWTEPERAWFALVGDDVPFFHPNGERLFFLSRRPLQFGGATDRERIWVMDRTDDGWTIPEPLPDTVNSMRQHWLFSVAKDGDLYFSSRRGADEGVFVAHYENGTYGEPQFLGFGGDTPYIAPDESYLITLDFVDGQQVNLIRYRKDGSWSRPLDIRPVAGNDVSGLCPMVSPDGKAFFYLGTPWGEANVCWTDAEFIKKLKKQL